MAIHFPGLREIDAEGVGIAIPSFPPRVDPYSATSKDASDRTSSPSAQPTATGSTPDIVDFTNAQHNHQNAQGGSVLDANAVGTGVLASGRLPTATTTAQGAVKQAVADADTARGTVTAASAPTGVDSIDRATLNTNLTTMRDNVHTELALLHTELNDLKAKLRTSGVLAV